MIYKHLSIIVPTLNEQDNLETLLQRIDTALSEVANYEVIIIDDHSTDNTKQIANSLSDKYPLVFYEKMGKAGKAYSIMEGITHANYSLIAFIDADLQYPPEVLPEMIKKMDKGADVVVASRVAQDISIVRKITSRGFNFLFGKLLHGINQDVQSGLKMFRAYIPRRFSIDPTPWTFDLEFLLKAREAGYKIRSVPIHFSKRNAGKTKVKILQTSFEIGLSALLMKFRKIDPIPFLPETIKEEGRGFHFKGRKLITHTPLRLSESAFISVNGIEKILIFAIILALFFAFKINWHTSLVVAVALMTTFYFTDLLFNLFVVYRSFTKNPDISISKGEMEAIDESKLPKYIIMCPMYKEWKVLPQFIKAMNEIDYPKDKMQAILLLEADDQETIQKVQGQDLPSFFKIVVIPDSMPKTKPKALNYALSHIEEGEYAVIYDAEDIPEPLQLKKAVLAFEQGDEKNICVQAKLNFYNPNQNLLTRLFSAEYSLWFDLILPGLQSINAPIPLGGTSNHFRVSDLRKLRGWDPFNVTEDADLGMRIFKKGYKTTILDSTTMEEANSNLKNWINQRSRWIKGYMQTYLVHIRDPKNFMNIINPRAFTFQLIIGGKILSILINPFMWFLTLSYFLLNPISAGFIQSLFPKPIYYMGVLCLLFGNFLYVYYYMMGAVKRKQWSLILVSLFAPIYWLMISFAASIAFIEILYKPHYWHKTKHGLHIKEEKKDQVVTRPAISVQPAL